MEKPNNFLGFNLMYLFSSYIQRRRDIGYVKPGLSEQRVHENTRAHEGRIKWEEQDVT
jgi:hypothetical protein